jgi:hypothetical protein
MILYGAQLDSQARGDRTVTQAERDVIGDLHLARGQPQARCRRWSLARVATRRISPGQRESLLEVESRVLPGPPAGSGFDSDHRAASHVTDRSGSGLN